MKAPHPDNPYYRRPKRGEPRHRFGEEYGMWEFWDARRKHWTFAHTEDGAKLFARQSAEPRPRIEYTEDIEMGGPG